MLIINDLHLNTRRKAGTTPASQDALRGFIFDSFSGLLDMAQGEHLVILGDLFDSFDVEARDIVATFNLLNLWLDGVGSRLTLVMGNHDASAKGSKLSSFHLLAHMLCTMSGKVKVVSHGNGLTHIENDAYTISHQLNQELFNIEIEKAIKLGGGTLLLHANLENGFAQHADHSLNVDSETTDRLIAAGWNLVFAHEHQHRIVRDGRVVVIGNQIPTSVADLLDCDMKYALKLSFHSPYELIPILKVDDVFARVNWRDLDDAPERHFIRVEGDATANEAVDAVNAIAKFRQNSGAFVITNSIKVEGAAEFDTLAEMSFNQITTFSVLDALLEELEPREREAVKELLEC